MNKEQEYNVGDYVLVADYIGNKTEVEIVAKTNLGLYQVRKDNEYNESEPYWIDTRIATCSINHTILGIIDNKNPIREKSENEVLQEIALKIVDDRITSLEKEVVYQRNLAAQYLEAYIVSAGKRRLL